jgi:D-galactarolactone cycloisomerase
MSRIAEVKTHPISIPLAQALWTAHEELKDSSLILVEVRTEDGIAGYGLIHGSPQKVICEWVARFEALIRGMEATASVAVWEKLFALTSPRPGGMGGRDGLPPPLPRSARPQVMAAIGGIDIALWDIRGKSAGVPV